MLRIIRNKFRRHHRVFIYFLIIIVLCVFIHSNLNSGQIIAARDPIAFANVFQKINFTRLELSDVSFDTTIQPYTGIIQEIETTVESITNNYTINTTTSMPVTTTNPGAYRVGHVHSHLWRSICTVNTPSLVQHPLFPLWPSARGHPEMPDELESVMSDPWSAQRITGLLYPPVSGKYRFKIYSDTLSEFWLSSSEEPGKTKLLARNNRNIIHSIEFEKGPLIPVSKRVHLRHGQAYFFDILHGVNNAGEKRVRIRWMLPRAKIFTGIPKTAVSTYLSKDDSLDPVARRYLLSSASLANSEQVLKSARMYHWENKNFSKPFRPYSSYNRENLFTVKFANRWQIMSVFKECEYAPSYTKKRKFKRFEGVHHTHYTDVFPYDESGGKWWSENAPKPVDAAGNAVVSEKDVIDIVKKFMAAVEAEFPGEYILANVINLERNVDKEYGKRFFLELLLIETRTKQLQRISEFVYQLKSNPNTLCKPKGLKWSPRVTVNVILTTKNQGPWVIHYIKNMAEIVHATSDDNVHFIVVDYGNNGVDVAGEFRKYNVTNFTIMKKEGKFHKTLAIDEAAKSVKDDNSIVFLTDLHLNAPHSLFENVRKHTVQGKMTFTPVVFRLSKCARPDSYYNTTTASGFWEGFGYGIFSTYKSDWKAFGGVNVTQFKHKWGGEDWEMVDRVLAKGYEIERIRLPYFYHFYHDKTGMWNQA
ncbi:uncharacterized protein LOC110236544 [Exaiptasia diaphana]|uniref:Hexosyltransferase n=1 Tax=Exaiptasia diaphana TaxID=2652724 RepID=A0A913X2V0_EXADI|nr:uncharacterized protein LOC110236544 [Exaiptasia diaphana]